MKKFAILYLILFSAQYISAQQLTFSSQYMLNPYMVNPGAAGSRDYIPIALTFRQQWAGFDQAPRTQTLSAHMSLNDHHGVGMMFYNDVMGPLKRLNFQATYAYHVEFKDHSKLGLGVSAIGKQNVLDGSMLNLNSTSDQILTNATLKSTNFDVNFGAFYYTKKLYLGISAFQLFQDKYKFGANMTDATKQIRHYYVTGGYEFALGDKWTITPSTLIKLAQNTPGQFEINVKGKYNDVVWGGVTYRHNAAIVLMAGGTWKDVVLGYAYDMSTNDLKNYSSGTHEIYLAYRLRINKKVSSTSRMD